MLYGQGVIINDTLPTKIIWECVKSSGFVSRAKILGGWLLISASSNNMVFIPDPQHQWKLDAC